MEKLSKRRPQHFRTVFIKYLAVFCAMTLALIALLFYGFIFALSTGAVLPANMVERQLLHSKDAIIRSEQVTQAVVPAGCEYGVFSVEGSYLSGSLAPEDAMTAWEVTQYGSTAYRQYAYMAVDRDGEVCILRYQLREAYASAWANRFLPSPVVFALLLFLVCFLAGTAILASRFGRKLAAKMAGLNDATEKVRHQNLDFTTEPSGIVEIDNVLSSIDEMRTALKASLEKQWDMEHARKEQLSALAHDIKAPVTVIRGNVELFGETSQSEAQKQYLYYIQESTAQLERYVRQMIEVSKATDILSANIQPVKMEALVEAVEAQMKALANAKKIDVCMETENLLATVHVDNELFQRAILNVLANAMEHTPAGGIVSLHVEGCGNEVRFTVTDGGDGFSTDALRNATKEFYMGDKGRTPGEHYGMGLYIADSILKQHGGRLCLENAPQGGGRVTLSIPLLSATRNP